MPVTKMLDIGTGHLRKQDREALSRLAEAQQSEGYPSPHVYAQEYGWYISAGLMYGDSAEQAGQERLRDEGFSEEFVALMTFARDSSVAMVSFDAHGSLEPGFPVFDEHSDEEIADEDATPALR